MYFYNKNEATMSARIPNPAFWKIILTALGILVAIGALAVDVYEAHYNRNVDSAKKAVVQYTKSSSTTQRFDMAPAKGKLYYGWMQKKGTSKMKYTISFKKASKENFEILRPGSKYAFKKNGKYYGDWKVADVNGKDSYNFKIKKSGQTNKASKIRVELGLT
jgi:hypothetical protein